MSCTPSAVRGNARFRRLNLVGDFGGGSMFLLVGILSLALRTGALGRRPGDYAAMVDGSSVLAQMMFAFRHTGLWSDVRGTNMLDTGAPYYDVYECADGRYVAVGSIEPQFYAELLEKLGLDPAHCRPRTTSPSGRSCEESSPRASPSMTATIGRRCSPAGDACVTPVLSFAEIETEPHNTERGGFYKEGARSSRCRPRGSPAPLRTEPTPPGVRGRYQGRPLGTGYSPQPTSRLGWAYVVRRLPARNRKD